MTVKQDAGNLLLLFYDELITKGKRIVDTKDVVDNINWSGRRINTAFNYLNDNGLAKIGQTGCGNIRGVQIFRVSGLSSQGIDTVEDTKKFKETFSFEVSESTVASLGILHKEQHLNIEKQESGRDLYNVGGDIIIQHSTSEILKELILNHNDDLRKFLRQSKERLPVIVDSESIEKCDEFGFSEFSLLFSIEIHPLFEDMKYHLPNDHKDFFEKWNGFKEQIFDYDNKRNDIFNNFKDYKEFNIKYPAASIYARTVSLVKEENSLPIKYDYFSDIELKYGTETVSFSLGYVEKDKIELVKEKHKDISKEYAEKYKTDIKEIINIRSQLIQKRIELEKVLNALTFFTLSPNVKCKFMKDITQEPISIPTAHEQSESLSSLKIFLCHSSGDKIDVRDLYQRLRVEGFNPWLDEDDLLPGQEWQLEIPKVVKESDVVIVCLSRSSISKEGYVQKEIKYALDAADEKPEGTIFIIPLKLEECNFPERLSRWQWVNLYEDKGFEKLMCSLQKRNNQLKKKENAAKKGAELNQIEYEAEVKLKAEQEAKDREFHTKNLRAMVQTWQELLPKIPPTEETKNPGRFDGFDISFIKNIEDDILFKDLFHHYPECEDVWNNFKKISDDYTSKKQAIYDLIKEKVSQKLVSENFNIESKIESGFCVSIFRDIIVEANDKISRYKHFSNDVIFGGVKKCQVYYCDVFKDGTRDDRTCHQLATTNDYETIEKIHKELIKECKAQCINKSKEIVELENKLRTDRDKLNFSLKRIYQKPFPQMDCEFVKGRI